MNESGTYTDAIDTIAGHFRRAYLDHPGDTGALLHAKASAGSAIANVLADYEKHRVLPRIVVAPDIADGDVDAIAASLGIEAHLVTDVITAVLGAQLRHAGAVNRAPITAAEVADIPGPAATLARRMLEDVVTEHVNDALADGDDWAGVHPISAEGDARAILAAARPLLDLADDVLDRDLEGCPFCDIARGRGPAEVVYEWPDAIAFTPLNPVTPGHVLIAPRTHVFEFTQEPWVSALVMRRAAELAVHLDPVAEYNLITSAGVAATQTIDHLHLHLVPRREGDGLALPWAPAPVEVTATKCAACGMRTGYVNHHGHVLGWGCANAGGDDRAILAPDLGRALVSLIDLCIGDDAASADDEPLRALVAAVAADPRVVDDAGPALASILESLAPIAPKMLRRFRTAEGSA